MTKIPLYLMVKKTAPNLSNIYDHDRLEDAYFIVESAQRQKFPESFRTDRGLFDLSNS